MRFEWCSRCDNTTTATYHNLCAKTFTTIFEVTHHCDCPHHEDQED